MSIPGLIGAVIGYFVTGGTPMGAAQGYAIGSAVGSVLFPGSSSQQGPRLSDLMPQASEYGKPIPIVYGTVGLGGNVIWASDLVEVQSTTTQGGKGGPSVSTTTSSYFGNFAIAMAEGERDISRLWAGPEKRLIWDGVTLEGGGKVRFYTGSELQLPDPLMESYLGAGNVPAYRGTCYVVFEMFPLANDGNRIPFMTAEVGRISSNINRAPVYLGAASPTNATYPRRALLDPTSGLLWSVNSPFYGATGMGVTVSVNSDVTQTQVAVFPMTFTYYWFTTGFAYVPQYLDAASPLAALRVGRNLVVVAGVGPTSGTDTYLVFDADLKQYLGSVDGVYQGSGSIQGLVYNPIRKVLLGLAANAKLVIDPLKAPVLGSYLSLGVSLGAVNIGVCLVTKDYLAVFVDGSTTACVLHRLDTYAFYAQITLAAAPQQGAQAFYDNDRNRIVCVNPTAGSPLSLTIIDVATATASTTTVIQATDADTSPAVSFAAKGGVYQGGKYVIGANGPTPNGTTLFVIDPTTLLAQKTYTYEAYAALQLTADLLSPVSPRSYVYSFDATQVKRLYYKPSSLGGQPLSEVVADLSQRATLTAGQLDVSALTDTVNGYAIARQTTVRAAIDALRPAYYFDAVERDAKVVYVKRGGAIVVTVPDTDLAAGEGKAASDDLLRTRQMEVELPHSLNVTYLSAATDYSAAAKLSRRLIGKSVNEATLGLPLVLSDATAQAIADANMHVAYVQRLSFQFALPRKYSYLEPTDIVVVKGHTLLITKISASPGGVLKVEAVADDANFYTPNAIVTETPTSGKLVYVPSPSRLELM